MIVISANPLFRRDMNRAFKKLFEPLKIVSWAIGWKNP